MGCSHAHALSPSGRRTAALRRSTHMSAGSIVDELSARLRPIRAMLHPLTDGRWATRDHRHQARRAHDPVAQSPTSSRSARIAIFDLLEDNSSTPARPYRCLCRPYRLRRRGRPAGDRDRTRRRARRSRLIRCSASAASAARSGIISRSATVISGDPRRLAAQIETVDMARRGLHNEAPSCSMERLRGQDRDGFRHRPPAVHPDLRAAHQGSNDGGEWHGRGKRRGAELAAIGAAAIGRKLRKIGDARRRMLLPTVGLAQLAGAGADFAYHRRRREAAIQGVDEATPNWPTHWPTVRRQRPDSCWSPCTAGSARRSAAIHHCCVPPAGTDQRRHFIAAIRPSWTTAAGVARLCRSPRPCPTVAGSITSSHRPRLDRARTTSLADISLSIEAVIACTHARLPLHSISRRSVRVPVY